MADQKICSVEGCGNPHHAREYCTKHYLRFKKHGDPNGGVHRSGVDCSGVCSVEGCGMPGRLGGMCQSHWRRFRKYGDPLIDGRSLKTKECSVDGCVSRASGHGLCGKHYARWRKYGSPLTLKTAADGELAAWLASHAEYDGNGCLIWPFNRMGARGYAGFVVVNGIRDNAYRHMCRIVYGGPPSPAHQAAHSCGNGHLACVHPKHLRWALPVENMADREAHGTMLRGERAPNAKLTAQQVSEIRAAGNGVTQRGLARTYGVSRATINAIRSGRTWVRPL